MKQKTKIHLFIVYGIIFHLSIILLAVLVCDLLSISYYFALLLGPSLFVVCGALGAYYQSKCNLFTVIDASFFIYSYLRYGKWIRHNNIEYLISYKYGELEAVYFINSFVYDHCKITLYFKGEPEDFNRITDVINTLINKRLSASLRTNSEFVKWDGYLDQESRRVGNINKLLK